MSIVNSNDMSLECIRKKIIDIKKELANSIKSEGVNLNLENFDFDYLLHTLDELKKQEKQASLKKTQVLKKLDDESIVLNHAKNDLFDTLTFNLACSIITAQLMTFEYKNKEDKKIATETISSAKDIALDPITVLDGKNEYLITDEAIRLFLKKIIDSLTAVGADTFKGRKSDITLFINLLEKKLAEPELLPNEDVKSRL